MAGQDPRTCIGSHRPGAYLCAASRLCVTCPWVESRAHSHSVWTGSGGVFATRTARTANSVFLFYPPCHRLLRLTPGMPRIPDLPGLLVQHNSDQERWLKRHVASLCKIDNERYVAPPSLLHGRTITSSRLLAFPGASPSASPQRTWTSWRGKSASRVRRARVLHCGTHLYLSFWVAEKSDGVRVLLLVQTDPSGDQMVYLVRASSPRPCPARRHSRTSRPRAPPDRPPQ